MKIRQRKRIREALEPLFRYTRDDYEEGGYHNRGAILGQFVNPEDGGFIEVYYLEAKIAKKVNKILAKAMSEGKCLG